MAKLPRGGCFGVIVLFLAAFWQCLQRFSPLGGMVPLLNVGMPWGFTEADLPALDGKTFVVTGASAGLGRGSTKWLVASGGRVVMACRSMTKCQAVREQIAAELGSKGAHEGSTMQRMVCHHLDLDSLHGVKASATSLLEQEGRLDSLILNAGVGFSLVRTSTDDGIEGNFGVNHLGHFYFGSLLLERVVSSQPATIVLVSSIAAWFATSVPLSMEELRDEGSYDPIFSYFNSKLANVLFANELQSRIDNSLQVYVNSVQPGGVATEFINKTMVQSSKQHGSRLAYFLVQAWKTIATQTTWDSDTASLTIVASAVAPWISSPTVKEPLLVKAGFFAPMACRAAMPPMAKNKTLAKELWSFSEHAIAELMAGS